MSGAKPGVLKVQQKDASHQHSQQSTEDLVVLERELVEQAQNFASREYLRHTLEGEHTSFSHFESVSSMLMEKTQDFPFQKN